MQQELSPEELGFRLEFAIDLKYRGNQWNAFSRRLAEQVQNPLTSEDVDYLNAISRLLLQHFTKVIPSDTKFYRARIIPGNKMTVEVDSGVLDGEGLNTIYDRNSPIRGYFEKEDVMAPPANRAQANRASKEGVRYLYVTDNAYTALAEVRPSILEIVSVKELTNKVPIQVVCLPTEDKYWEIEHRPHSLDTKNYALAYALSWAFSRPINRKDAAVEYLPTQMLVDYIRKNGPDVGGIAYPSFQSRAGMNYALFDPEILEPTDARERIIRIQDVSYECCDLNDLEAEVKPETTKAVPRPTGRDIQTMKFNILQDQMNRGGKNE